MSWAGWRGEGAREDGGIWAVSLPHVLSKGEAAASSTPQLSGPALSLPFAICAGGRHRTTLVLALEGGVKA